MSVLAGQATWQGTLFLYHSRSGVWTRMNRIGVSSRVGATDADRASPAGTLVAPGDANSAVREEMEALGLYGHCPIIRNSDQGHSSRKSQTTRGPFRLADRPPWRHNREKCEVAGWQVASYPPARHRPCEKPANLPT